MKRSTKILLTMGVALVAASAAQAQPVRPNAPDEYRNARRLGGSTSFHQPPLTTVASLKHHPVYFLGEGRLFFDEIDDVSNNYQFWAGVRVHF